MTTTDTLTPLPDEAVRLRSFHGAAAAPYFKELARLRIEVFREWPYIYDGDLANEEEYIATYLESADCLLVLAMVGNRAVGATMCLPLEDECPEFKEPFLTAGLDPAEYFYLAESVLLPDWRGQGIGHRFFDERERHARALGRFRYTTFCAVERPDGHALQPKGYRGHAKFWEKRGYQRRSELVAHFIWKDLGEQEKTAKPLVFWTRPLD